MIDLLIDLLTPIFLSMGASAADVANYLRALSGYVYTIVAALVVMVAVMVGTHFLVKKGTRHVVRWSSALAFVLVVVLVVNLIATALCMPPFPAYSTPPERRFPTMWQAIPGKWLRIRPGRVLFW